MSRLDALLLDEYKRLENQKLQFIREIAVLPVGHVVFKKVDGKTYIYLQRFERDVLYSEPVAPENLSNVQSNIKRRNTIKKAIKEIEFDQKRIVKILSPAEKHSIVFS